MNKKLSITWENTSCHLCASGNKPKPILLYGKPVTKGQFGYEIHPVICECGLVYLNPRWTSETYDEFYKNYYDELYRLELKPDYGISGVMKNMRQVWERAEANIKSRDNIENILDIGCGSGHGLRYLKEQIPHSNIFGIEASPACCDTLQTVVNAKLVDTDVDGPWVTDNQGRFDFIVMRHVVEHLLTPVDSLRWIKTVLAPEGTIYIAVPDMMHPRTILRDYDKWWEYYFRAVHPYYYCKETFFATLRLAGLYPYTFGEDNEEVWCLVGSEEHDLILSKNVYWEQIRILRKYLPS